MLTINNDERMNEKTELIDNCRGVVRAEVVYARHFLLEIYVDVNFDILSCFHCNFM